MPQQFTGTDLCEQVENIRRGLPVVISEYLCQYSNFRGKYAGWYKDLDGKRQPFSCGTADERIARQYYRSHVTSLIEQAATESKVWLSLPDFLCRFIEYKRGENDKQSTIDEYERILKQFISYLGRHAPEVRYVHQVRTRHIDDFVLSPAEDGRGVAVSTKRNRTTAISLYFDLALRHEVVREHPYPVRMRFRSDSEEAEWLSTFELIQLTTDNAVVTFRMQWLIRYFLLSFYLGARSGNVRTEVDEDADAVLKRYYMPRTKSGKPHTLQLGEQAAGIIWAQRAWKMRHPNPKIRNSNYLFPTPEGDAYSASAISKQIKRLLLHSFPDRTRLCLHSMRHTAATFLAEQGVPLAEISRWLGHSSVEITKRYIHVEPTYEKVIDAYNQLPDLRAILKFE